MEHEILIKVERPVYYYPENISGDACQLLDHRLGTEIKRYLRLHREKPYTDKQLDAFMDKVLTEIMVNIKDYLGE